MKQQHTITTKLGTSTLKLVTAVVLLITTNTSLQAMEVRIADHEVWGREQIVSGKIDEGIRILESNVRVPTDRTSRAAYITNLCAAYILKGDLVSAKDYCDRGIQMRASDRNSYNNRAVLNAMQGNLEAAVEDLLQAGPSETLDSDSIGAVAHRNLVRVQTAIAARKANDDALLTDSASK